MGILDEDGQERDAADCGNALLRHSVKISQQHR